MAAEIPILLRIKAERETNAQGALNVIEKATDGLSSAVDRAASQLAILDQAFAKVGQAADAVAAKLGGVGDNAKDPFSGVVSSALKAKLATQALGTALGEALGGAGGGFGGLAPAVSNVHDELEKASKGFGDTDDKAKKATTSLTGLATALGTAFAGIGATFGGLSAYLVKTAGDFELLEAKLATVQGSAVKASQGIQRAQQYAAKTPFDVKGVVTATVQLEVYKQRSEEILPRVAALAAGMGKSIEETSLVIGKSLSGSLEGFESLRNTYGISTAELKRYGAEVNKAGGILVQTEGQIEKARNALLRIIDTRFGGAIERQAATMSGSLSNAKDAAINLANSMGQSLAPIVTTAAKTFTGFVDTVNKAPTILKGMAAGAIALVGGVGALGGSALLATAGLLALNTQLAAAATELPIVARAAGITSGALSAMGTAATAAGRGLTFLATNPFGIALLATVAATTALSVALKSYEERQRNVGALLAEESRQLADSVQSYAEVTQAVNAAGKSQGIFIERVASGSDGLLKLTDAIDKLKAADLAAEFAKQGKSLQSIRNDLKDAEARLRQFIKLRNDLADLAETSRARGGLVDVEVPERLQGVLGSTSANLEEITAASERMGFYVRRAKDDVVALGASENKLSGLQEALSKIGTGSKQISDYLRFSEQLGDVNSLTNGLSVLDKQIQSNASNLAKAGIADTSRQGLLSELLKRDPSNEADAQTIEAIKTQLNLLDDQADKTQALAKIHTDASRERIRSLQAEIQEERTLRQVSYKEQLDNLNKQLAEAKKLGAEGTAEVRRIEGERRKIKLDEAKAGFDDATKAQLESLRELEAEGRGSAAQVGESIDAILDAIAQWRKDNADLIKQYPELAKKVQDTVDKLTVDRVRASTRALNENFTTLRDQVSHLGDDAVTAGDKLAAIDRGIALVKAAQLDHSVDNGKADELLADLGRSRLQVERQITAERQKQAVDIANAQIAVYQQEIQLLEQRRDAGENVDNLLIAKREELYLARIDALNEEYKAELKTATDKVAVQQEYQLKLKQLENEKTLERRQRLKAEEKDVKDSFDRRATTARAGAQKVQTAATTGAPVSSPDSSGRPAPVNLGFDSGPIQGQARSSEEISAAVAASEEARRAAFGLSNPVGNEVVRRIDEARAQQIGLKDAAQAKRVEDSQKAQVEAALKRNGLPGLSAPNLDAIAPDPSKPGTQAEKQREAGSDGGSTTNVYANLHLNADEEAIIRKVFARMATQHRHHRNTNGGGGRPGR
ncbi:MAG: hypothetical protein AB7S38_29035 [Vulcanimicrobiota bacterium]